MKTEIANYLNKEADKTKAKQKKEKLEYLRKQIENENISYSEIAELQSLTKYINKNDVVLLEWAGVSKDNYKKKWDNHIRSKRILPISNADD